MIAYLVEEASSAEQGARFHKWSTVAGRLIGTLCTRIVEKAADTYLQHLLLALYVLVLVLLYFIRAEKFTQE